MGLTFAPLGALLPELFPTAVAYTGASALTTSAAFWALRSRPTSRSGCWNTAG